MTAPSESDRILRIAERAAESCPWVDAPALTSRLHATLATPVHRESLRHTTFDVLLRLFEDVVANATVDPTFSGFAQAGVTSSPLLQDTATLCRQLADHLPEPERHAGADLALLAAPSGRLITVTDSPATPLRIEDAGQGAAVTVLRVERGVMVDLIERVLPNGPRGSLLIVELAEDAILNHYRAVAPGTTALWLGTSVRVAKGACYRANLIARGRSRARLETHVVLAEPQSRVDLTGASVVTDGEHLDQPVIIEHRAPDTTSAQRFHSIGAGKGRSSFNGRIHIHAGAVRSDAWLGNRNLALHPEAEINTKPELEIYTDDVRCAHGATIGQLDAEALFLMQARGIPEAAARRLLAHAFLRACIAEPLEIEGQELIGALPA